MLIASRYPIDINFDRSISTSIDDTPQLATRTPTSGMASATAAGRTDEPAGPQTSETHRITVGGGPFGVISKRTRVVILGAAGRDYHDFNTLFRVNAAVEVVAITHAQIPYIASKSYPPSLAGPLYPNGVPILLEKDLEAIIKRYNVDVTLLAYSDLSYNDVTKLSLCARSSGSAFVTLSYDSGTMLRARKPVIAVTAVRTGCGKSQVVAYIVNCLRRLTPNKQVVTVRHPMPYGDLEKQVVERFATMEDLEKYHTTIEEREEYEQHIKRGVIVYAGVDYEAILRTVEMEADFIIWDGGNNDMPFFKPDLWVCVADPLRPGHEESYFPGDVNFKLADVIIINKCNSATKEGIEHVRKSARRLNSKARVILTNSEVTVDHPELVKGKRVCCVEDGPTITHGGAPTGAAFVAARQFGAKEVVDPRPCFEGTIKEALEKYPHIGPVVPALGYSEKQIVDLEYTLNCVDCDTVLIGSPSSVDKLVKLNKPAAHVSYDIKDHAETYEPNAPKLSDTIESFLTEELPKIVSI